MFDDDGPSYWQPGVALPLQTPPNAIDNTTPSSRSYAAPHQLLHRNLTDEGPAEVRSDELNQTTGKLIPGSRPI